MSCPHRSKLEGSYSFGASKAHMISIFNAEDHSFNPAINSIANTELVRSCIPFYLMDGVNISFKWIQRMVAVLSFQD